MRRGIVARLVLTQRRDAEPQRRDLFGDLFEDPRLRGDDVAQLFEQALLVGVTNLELGDAGVHLARSSTIAGSQPPRIAMRSSSIGSAAAPGAAFRT